MDDDGLPPRRRAEWRVVHAPRVAVRESPGTNAKMLGSRAHGDTVCAEREENGWIKLGKASILCACCAGNLPLRDLSADGTAGWMLIDGASVGLGPLLERLPVPSTSITLRFSRPDDGKALTDLQTHMSATIKEAKAAVAAVTGLRAEAMAFARGRMGQRISDSAANLYGDDETLWSCGYMDGMEVGYMYMGDAAQDLARGPTPMI